MSPLHKIAFMMLGTNLAVFVRNAQKHWYNWCLKPQFWFFLATVYFWLMLCPSKSGHFKVEPWKWSFWTCFSSKIYCLLTFFAGCNDMSGIACLIINTIFTLWPHTGTIASYCDLFSSWQILTRLPLFLTLGWTAQQASVHHCQTYDLPRQLIRKRLHQEEEQVVSSIQKSK